MNQLAFSCLFSVVAVGLPSQATHVVGGAGLPNIDAALAIAAPGDTVLVQPGVYPPFHATVGVNVVASGTPVSIDCCLGNGEVLCDLPPGQELSIADITVRHQVFVRAGRVTLDRCSLLPSQSFTPVVVRHAALHLQECEITGFGGNAPVVSVVDSAVTIAGGEIMASGFGTLAGLVDLDASVLHASGVSLVNGQWSWGGPSLRAINGSRAWLSDCELQTFGASQCAIETIGSLVRTDRCALSESGTSCDSGAGGLLLGVVRPEPLAEGQTFAIEFTTNASGFVVVFAGPALDTADWGPVLEQPSWLDDQQSFAAALLLADAAGAASVSWQIPTGPGIAGQRLWFKGISGLTFPLQVSPVVGGVVR